MCLYQKGIIDAPGFEGQHKSTESGDIYSDRNIDDWLGSSV